MKLKREPALIQSEAGKEFLDAFNPSTKKIYRAGLRAFLSFYQETGKGETLEDFLDAVEEDVRRDRRSRKRVARNVLKDFVRWLEERKYTPKTIRTYISTVQSLGGYYGLKLSTRYVSLPSSQPVSKKHPWTLNEVGEFILGMKDPELRSISATIFQSGISVGDVLGITWGDVKREYQKDVVPLCFDFSRKKTDVPFMTFIGEFGVNLLREYLDTVEKKRDPDTIYSISERLVEDRFQDLAKERLGDYQGYNPMRPHSLRSAFRTLLGDAGQQEIYIEFFMGHRVAEHKRVYVSKSREGWRKTYKKYESALTPGELG